MSDPESIPDVPLSVPEISGNEWEYVRDCLDTGWVSSVGQYVTRFENSLASYLGVPHAIATVNGTSALHLALVVLGVGCDDEVLVPSLTFVAPVNACTYCGASPIFVDCDPSTLCMDVRIIDRFLRDQCEIRGEATFNRKTGRRVAAVIPVHVFGHPVDMAPLVALSREFNIAVVEDATESLGTTYHDQPTGTIGKLGCFSFNGNKLITTGGGGMLVTDEAQLASLARHLSTQAKCDPFEYVHDAVGFNYRLTNVQAAIGVAQLERLGEFLQKKRANASRFRELLRETRGIEFLWEQPWAHSNFWFYTIRVNPETRVEMLRNLLHDGIQVRPLWKPIPTLPIYRQCEFLESGESLRAYDSCINLPCSVSLSEIDIERVVSSIRRTLPAR